MRTLFRLQQSYNNVFRVGDVFSNRPDCEFTSIQDAINAAVAAGHTNNDNPALIEVYQKNGGYNESLVLQPGIHIIGVGGTGRQNQVAVNGNISYNPPAGTRTQNRVTLENIIITSALGAHSCLLDGVNQFEIAFYNCVISREGLNDGFRAITKLNTQVGGNARLYWIDSSIFFEDTTAGVWVVNWGGGRFRIYGSNNFIGSFSSPIGAVFRFFNNTQFGISSDSADGAIIQSSGDNVFIMASALGNYVANFCTIRNTNGAGGNIVLFSQAATFSFSKANLRLQTNSSKIAADGGAGGSVIFSHCAFNVATGTPGSIGRSYVDPTLAINFDAQRNQVERNGNQVIAYVGQDGFQSIQEALNWLASSGTFRPVVKLAPGNYDEDLNIPAINGGVTFEGIVPFAANPSIYRPETQHAVRLLSNITLNTDTCPSVNFHNIECEMRDGAPFLDISGGTYTSSTFKNCYILSNDVTAAPVIRFDTTLGGNELLNFESCHFNRGFGVTASLVETTANVGFKTISFTSCSFQLSTPDENNGKVKGKITTTVGGNVAVRMFNCSINGSTGQLHSIGVNDFVQLDHCNVNVTMTGGTLAYFSNNGRMIVLNSAIGIGQGLGEALARDGTQAAAQIGLTGNAYAPGDGYNVNGTNFVNGVDFAVGANEAATAINIAAAINNAASLADPNLQNKIYAIANGVNVDLWSIPWTAAANAFTLAAVGAPPATITAWAGGANGSGGSYQHGASAYLFSNLLQGTIGEYDMPETVTTF